MRRCRKAKTHVNCKPTVNTTYDDAEHRHIAAPIMRDVATQTDQIVGTQTELTRQCFIELFTGMMQIWDSTKNKDKRLTATKSLIEHVLQTTETTKCKRKISIKSPVTTRKTDSGRKPSQPKGNGPTSEQTLTKGSSATHIQPVSQTSKVKLNKTST